MSTFRLPARVRLTIFAALFTAPVIHAQTLTWDANTSITGAQNGLGTWNLTNTNWWTGTGNASWVNSNTAVANIGVVGGTGVNQEIITVGQDIQLKELNFRAIGTATPASNHQYFINGDIAGRVMDFGQNGLIQMEDFSSGGSQFINLQGNLRLKGENLRIQKYGSGTAFQFLTLGMSTNPDLKGTLTIGGSIYATIAAPGTVQAVDRVVVEAGGSAPLSGTNPNYTMPFSLAGFGNSLTNSGTSYGAIRFVSNNTTMSGGILLTADAGVHSNFSGANGTTGLVINSPITDGGNNFAFHRFAFTRGNGTLTLSAANTYGGATVLGRALSGYSGGITILDFTAPTAPQDNIIYNGLSTPGALSFIGGNSATVLRLTGKESVNHSQAFGNTTVNGTHSVLELQSGLGGSMNMSLGTLTRTDKNATFSITAPTSGSVTTTQPDGFLGAWATYTDNQFSRSWAQVISGAITNGYIGDTLYTTGESLSAAPYTTASNLSIISASTGPVTMGAGATQLDTVSMADYANDRVIQIATGQTLRLGTLGGIQIVSGAGSLTVGETVATGSLTSGGSLNMAGPLFLSNHSSTSLLTINSNIVNNGTGATTLVVNGAPGSRTILTGTNTYTGGTQISSGTLEVRSNGALGTSGTVTVVDGATLALSGGITLSRPLAAVGGFGDGNNGAIRSISGDNIITGSITQSAMFMLTADAGASLTIQPPSVITYSSMLTVGGAGTVTINAALIGAGPVTKTGTGLLVLGGNNTFTGATTVSTGTLKLGSATALGASASVLTTAGGTLDLNGFNSDRAISLNGTGVGSNGTLINSSSATTSTLTGTMGLNSATSIGGSGNIYLNNAGGIVGNVLLTKVGSGTLTVTSTAASARSGVNQIDAGTLRLQAPTVLATVGTGAMALNGGTLSLGFNATGTLTSVVNVMNDSTIIADRATAGDGGQVFTLSTLTIGDSKLTVKAGDNVSNGTMGLTLGSVVIGGMAMLPGDPTFDVQSTAAAATTLTLGALSDQAIAPRTITFQNSGSAASTVTLGTAATSLVNGTLVNVASAGGATTMNLNVASALGTLSQLYLGTGNTLSMGASQTFASLAGGGTIRPVFDYTLTLGNALNTTAYDTDFSGVLANSGTGILTLIKGARSTQTFSGSASNTYTGLTTVNTGTLVLAKTGGAIAVGGSLTIGAAASSTAGDATVRLMGNNQIAPGAMLTINPGGTLDLNGYNQSVTTFPVLAGAKVIGNGSTLTVSVGNAFLTSNGYSFINTNYQITDITTGTNTITVTNSTDVLTINGQVTQGSATGTIIKAGSGTLVLNGSNSYSGNTTVNAGVLNIRHANALGTTAGSTSIASGGTLQIQGGITTSAEALTLNGAGFAGSGGVGLQTGALVNVSGTNNYSGLVTLGSAATIASNSGTLNLTNPGTITGSAFTLTLTGAGDGRIDSVIGIGTGPVTKAGTGTWVLTGANTSTGILFVENGTLQVGDGTSGSWTTTPSVMMSGSGRFNYQGTTTGSTQTLNNMTFSSGEGTVQSTYGGAGNTTLTFAALGNKTVGATGNFVISGGVNGSTNKITLTAQTPNSFLNAGIFFGGSSYAWYDAGGFVRGMAYGTDTGTATSIGGTTLASATHQQLTGSVSAQTSATFTTLNLSGNGNFTLANGQTVTVNGILKSGNTAGGSVISGGNGIQAATGAEMVIRTAGPNDLLTVNTPILANGANALTKSGPGTLVLNGLNTYTGATNVAAGTLRLGRSGTLTTSILNVRLGATLDLYGQTITNALTVSGMGVDNNGALINSSSTPAQVGAIALSSSTFIGGSGDIVSSGALSGLSPIVMTKVGSGTVTFGDALNGFWVDSVRTGPNQINEGVLRISNSSSAIGTSLAPLILNGGTLSIGSAATITSYPTSVTADSAIITDAYYAGTGLHHQLGNLIMGGHTLTVTAGSNIVTANTNAGLGFVSTTFTGNPVFDVQSPTAAAGGTTTLMFGALNDQGIAKNITFRNSGSSSTNSIVTLVLAASSLMDGTTVNLNSGPNAGVTMNLSIANALGTLAQVSVNGQSRLHLGAAQTIASLSGSGTVSTTGAFALTIGNANSSVLDTNFSGRLMDGTAALSLIKSGLGTQTLSGDNTYTGATTVTAGILRLGSTTALGSTPTVTISPGGTIDLNGQNSNRNFSSISGTGHNSIGALINTSTTPSLITGTSVQGSTAKIGGVGDITFSNTGGLTGSALLTKIGTNTLTFISTTTSARNATVQIDEGTFRIQAATAINPVGIGPFALNGGTLSVGFDVANPMANGLNLLSSSSIVVDRATPGAGGFSHNLGVLAVGSDTLTIKPGANVTSGTMGLNIGTTMIGNPSLLPGNPTFDIQSTAAAAMTVTFGALTDQAIAPRTITFQNSGTQPSTVNLNTLATSLVDGTVVNLASTGAAVTVNLNVANAIGTFAQTTVGTGNTLSTTTSQTFASLSGGGTVTATAPSVLTIGNVLSPTVSHSVFTGTLAGGSNVSVVKVGAGNLTLGGSSTFAGGLTVSGGDLILANSSGSATGSGLVTLMTGSNLLGAGRIQAAAGRSVNLFGNLSPGTSPTVAGQIDILTSGTGTLLIDGSSVVVFSIINGLGQGDNTDDASSADLLRIGGTMTVMPGSTLRVEYDGTGTWAAGDQWQLFDWTSLSGSQVGNFTAYDLPTLTGDLAWDLSQLSTTGVLSVTGTILIPEPGRATLLAFAFMGLIMRRRRGSRSAAR